MNILFLCEENRARSQMAEGLARHFLAHKHDVSSAGSKPASQIHPMAVTVMAEIGIDISQQRPKSIEQISLDKMNMVIFLCAEEQCPTFPIQVRTLHWPIDNPVQDTISPEVMLRKFRKVRDELRRHIVALQSADQPW